MNGFEDFYKKEEQQIKDIWNSAIFVFDTNVLLNLYRYTEDTRKELLSILKNLEERLWMPHHVALEYNFNRLIVIQEQKDSYGNINKSIEKNYSSFINGLNLELHEYKKRHPRINIQEIITNFEETFTNINTQIQNANIEHPDFFTEDPVLSEINTLYNNKVGTAYEQLKINEIEKEGEKRYKNKVPPGYMDLKDKKDNKKYWDGLIYSDEFGDLIIWNQIMDKALNANQPIIFITDDEKEDWWEIIKGRITVGPRYELINEFKTRTKQGFYMYKTYRFMEFSNNFLESSINKEAIKEARELKTDPNLFINNRTLLLPYVNDDDWEIYLNKMKNAEDGAEINKANTWVIERNMESLKKSKTIDLSRRNFLIKGYAIKNFNADELILEINSIDELDEMITLIIANKTIFFKGDECEFTLKFNKDLHRNQIRRLLNDNQLIEIDQVIEI